MYFKPVVGFFKLVHSKRSRKQTRNTFSALCSFDEASFDLMYQLFLRLVKFRIVVIQAN